MCTAIQHDTGTEKTGGNSFHSIVEDVARREKLCQRAAPRAASARRGARQNTSERMAVAVVPPRDHTGSDDSDESEASTRGSDDGACSVFSGASGALTGHGTPHPPPLPARKRRMNDTRWHVGEQMWRVPSPTRSISVCKRLALGRRPSLILRASLLQRGAPLTRRFTCASQRRTALTNITTRCF